MLSNLSISSITVGLVLVASATSAGQEPPPIPAVTGTIALDSTVQKTYEGLNIVIVKTVGGIEHLFHLAGRTAAHRGVDDHEALRGLEVGSRVVVHDTGEGEQGPPMKSTESASKGFKPNDGVIMNLDRQAKTMVIRLADGSWQTLQLTERAASDVGNDIESSAVCPRDVVVYYSDDAGHNVAHYFKRLS